MAFSVIYDKALRPYEDWCKRGKPPDTLFIHNNDDIYYYLPDKCLIYIYKSLDYYYTDSILRIKPIDKTRKIEIIAVTCVGRDYMDMFADRELVGSGSFKFFKKVLKVLNLSEITQHFFGPDWTFKKLPNKRNHVFDHLKEHMTKFIRDFDTPNTTIGFYDYTRINAAIKIQTAYRGWKIRIKYRYNPHMCLGKYLLQKDFLELKI